MFCREEYCGQQKKVPCFVEKNTVASRQEYHVLQRRILWPVEKNTMFCREEYCGQQRRVRCFVEKSGVASSAPTNAGIIVSRNAGQVLLSVSQEQISSYSTLLRVHFSSASLVLVYSVQCPVTVYTVHCTICYVQCTVYSVQSTVYSVQCTLYFTVCNVECGAQRGVC